LFHDAERFRIVEHYQDRSHVGNLVAAFRFAVLTTHTVATTIESRPDRLSMEQREPQENDAPRARRRIDGAVPDDSLRRK
jgi:hypothetical protein